MTTLTTPDLYQDFVMPTYGRFDLALTRGEGSHVWDESGKAYLDFGAGIAVCSLGHCHPAVTKALSEQGGKLLHISNLYLNRPQAELARKIVELVGLGGKVFFCNSGAEANEGLYKLARKFGAPTSRYEIITFSNSFHGRTLGGISATAQEKVKVGFAPLVEGFVHVTMLPQDDYIYEEKRHMLVGTHRGHKYRLGDDVDIIVEGADVRSRKIDFALAGIRLTQNQKENNIKRNEKRRTPRN